MKGTNDRGSLIKALLIKDESDVDYLKFDQGQDEFQFEQANKHLLRNIQTRNVFNIHCCLKMENTKEKFNYTRPLLVILLATYVYVILQITGVQ